MNEADREWLQEVFQRKNSITFDSREDASKAHWLLIEADIPHSFGDFLIDEDDSQTFKAGITLQDRTLFDNLFKNESNGRAKRRKRFKD